MKKTTRNLFAQLGRMKKTEAVLAFSWASAMVLGVYISKTNITVGSVILMIAMGSALLGAANEVMMFKLRHKFAKSS